MKLIDLLVQELPKLGGWANTGEYCVQDFNGNLWFYKGGRPEYTSGTWAADCSSPDFSWTQWGLCLQKATDNSHSHVSHKQYEAALAASKQTVWDEDELPPIGMKCLTIGPHGDDSWHECKILAHTEFSGKPVAVFQYGDTISHSSEKWFKPLATEAERKREEATAEMSASIAKYTDMTFLEAIYEAVVAGEIKAFKLAD